MKCNKKLFAVAAAGALTVATAAPALAMENEFHGMFRTYFDDSNFTINNNGTSLYNPSAALNAGNPSKGVLSNADQNANFFETRLRINYTAKLNDDVRIVSRFETNYYYWGNSSYNAKRAGGGALGSRGVNLETKQIYLDLNSPSIDLNTKVGMQPFTDDFQGIFVDADMPGVRFTHNYTKGFASAGFFRWDDSANNTLTSGNSIYGKNTRDLYVLDGRFEVSKDFKVGGAYYFLNSNVPGGNPGDISLTYGTDPTPNFQMHVLGLNAEAAVGPVSLDGFLVGEFGKDHQTQRDISSLAANIGAKMAAGKGTAHANLLYVSGDKNSQTQKGTDHSFRVGSLESDFYNNNMTVLGRNQYSMVNDNAIVFDANNNGQGVIFGALGYDLPINDRLSTNANLGFAATDENNNVLNVNPVTGQVNSSKYLGTEINGEVAYKLNPFTTLTANAGYVFLGDYFKNTAPGGVTPDNVYDAKLIVTVAF